MSDYVLTYGELAENKREEPRAINYKKTTCRRVCGPMRNRIMHPRAMAGDA